jgi:hypothetical protein
MPIEIMILNFDRYGRKNAENMTSQSSKLLTVDGQKFNQWDTVFPIVGSMAIRDGFNFTLSNGIFNTLGAEVPSNRLCHLST